METITREELIAELQKLPEGSKILLSKDSEGNDIRKIPGSDIDCFGERVFYNNEDPCKHSYLEILSEDEIQEETGMTKEDLAEAVKDKEWVPAYILYPTV